MQDSGLKFRSLWRVIPVSIFGLAGGAIAQPPPPDPIDEVEQRLAERDRRGAEAGEFSSRFPIEREAYDETVLGPEGLRLNPVDPNEYWLDRESLIVNGNAVISYAAVGALLIDFNGTPRTLCSGTMIGCETFITANHCITGIDEESELSVYLQGEGVIPAEPISVPHINYNSPFADLALLKLDRPMESTDALRLATSSSAGAGTTGQIVGFGHTGENFNDAGIKRTGEIDTATCNDPSDGLVCWNYDGTKSSTCNMDSGGAVIVRDDDDVPMLGGVISRTDTQCGPGFQSRNVDVFQFIDWIKQQGGSDVGKLDCDSGSLKLFGGLSFSDGERIIDVGESETHYFIVPAVADRVRIALNGQDNFGLNFDLSASIGPQPGTSFASCNEIGLQNFETCELAASEDDIFLEVTVSLVAGGFEGSYQLSVTAL